MSIAGVSQPPATISQVSSSEDSEPIEITIDSRSSLFFVPAITAVALGALFIPNFSLGLAAGAAKFVCSIIGCAALNHSGILPSVEETTSTYHQAIRSMLLDTSIFGPIEEEGVFRGIIQPLIAHSIQILVPAAAMAAFGPSLSVAVVVSIVATSVFFGAMHFFNPHKNALNQAIQATVSGLFLGFMSAQFGIGAAIAAHIANNTIIGSALALQSERKIATVSALPA